MAWVVRRRLLLAGPPAPKPSHYYQTVRHRQPSRDRDRDLTHSLTPLFLPHLPPSSRHQYHRPGLLRVCVSEEQSRAEHSVVSSDCPVQSSARALTYIYLPCRPAAPPAAGAFLFAQLPRLRRFPPRANHASHTLDTLPGSSTGQELIASL